MGQQILAATPQTIAAIRRVQKIPLYANSRNDSSIVGGVASTQYANTFKVTDESDDENLVIGVINGAAPDSDYCGIVTALAQNIDVPNALLAVSDTAGYVCLIVDYEYIGDSDTPTYSAEISLEPTIPSEFDTNWRMVLVLGQYAVTDGSLTLSQLWTVGGQINVNNIRWV